VTGRDQAQLAGLAEGLAVVEHCSFRQIAATCVLTVYELSVAADMIEITGRWRWQPQPTPTSG